MSDELLAREHMCEVGRRLWQKGLIAGSEGNFCVRLSPERLLTTPSGVSKGHLEPQDLVVIDLDGSPVDTSGRPSSEIKIHLAAMRQRPDCMATVHAHPPTAVGIVLSGRRLPDWTMPESAIMLGPIAHCDFAYPGTTELAESLSPFLPDHKTFILANHGALTLGGDIFAACHRMESLEQVAKAIFVAELLGGAKPIPPGEHLALHDKMLSGALEPGSSL